MTFRILRGLKHGLRLTARLDLGYTYPSRIGRPCGH